MIGWLILAFYGGCGAIAYASHFAYFQRKFPALAQSEYREDLAGSVFIGLMGPAGLFIAIFSSGFFKYGLKWR